MRQLEYHLNASAILDIVGLSDKSSGQTIMFDQSIKQSIKPIEISVDYVTIKHYFGFNQRHRNIA